MLNVYCTTLVEIISTISRDKTNFISVSTKMFPSVPSKVKKNIAKLLTYYSNGIPSDQLLSRYMVCIYITC